MRYFEYELRGHNEVTAVSQEMAEQYILEMVKESGMHDVTIFIRERDDSLSLKELAVISEEPSMHRLTRRVIK